MLEVHAILQRQRCNENITKKTGTLSDAYDYTSRLNVIRFLYGQNGMWYRMNNDKNEYILTANDGMTVRVVAYRANYDSLSFTINNFCIEEYND